MSLLPRRSKEAPAISICIPVFQTEQLLERCLASVAAQKETFTDFEVLIINDCSDGTDEEGRGTKQVVRRLSKKFGLPVKLISHSKNRGLFEVRRTGAINARGRYITQLDSDDMLVPGALKALYDTAVATDADLVHGHSTAGSVVNGEWKVAEENRYSQIYYGTLEGHEVFRGWLIEKKFTANIWGKLVKRELYAATFEEIPYTQCNMAEDVLAFFFLGQKVKKYVGIQAEVYKYVVDTGMSSRRTIDSMHKFRMICSAASVFTIISSWLEEHKSAHGLTEEGRTVWRYPLAADEIKALKHRTRFYLYNNIMQMRQRVIPELQAEARAMLCDYWGEDFVAFVENDIALMEADARRKAEKAGIIKDADPE